MITLSKITVRKTGSSNYPWQVKCKNCQEERTHFSKRGVVAVNDKGIGNKSWESAMEAATIHTRLCNKKPPATGIASDRGFALVR